MMRKQIIEKVKDYVFNLLKNESTGHDYYHIQRVVKNTQIICQAEGLDDYYPTLLAYLHDVGDYKLHGGQDKTELYVQKILKNLIADETFITKLIKDIQLIGFKGGFNQTTNNLEVWVVADADRLDAMGAIGIARAFAYGGSQGNLLHDPMHKPEKFDSIEAYQKSKAPTLQHFYDKLLKLKELMKTKKGREMAEERHKFMKVYLDQFYKEWNI
ncbi:phosphohydrolase [Flavobacteriaceae bacterium Ap0902]|nr:phosphohydrolase [Flavobacteriaceae bacterium Ap0902]